MYQHALSSWPSSSAPSWRRTQTLQRRYLTCPYSCCTYPFFSCFLMSLSKHLFGLLGLQVHGDNLVAAALALLLEATKCSSDFAIGPELRSQTCGLASTRERKKMSRPASIHRRSCLQPTFAPVLLMRITASRASSARTISFWLRPNGILPSSASTPERRQHAPPTFGCGAAPVIMLGQEEGELRRVGRQPAN